MGSSEFKSVRLTTESEQEMEKSHMGIYVGEPAEIDFEERAAEAGVYKNNNQRMIEGIN